MPGFRLLDQFPVFLDRLGLPASGGRLSFYESGTTTPKNVYGDPDLTVNNGPTVLIGTDGRAIKDIWGSGVYRVRLYAADNTLIAEADNVQIPGGGGMTIPPLQAGQALFNDGSILIWRAIRELPDPSGQAGKIVGTDGTNYFLQAVAAQFSPVIKPGSIQLGTQLFQWGGDTIAPTNTTVANKAINFNTPFASVDRAFGTLNTSSGISSSGGIPSLGIAEVSLTGAKAFIDMNGYGPITSPCAFSWWAIGTAAS